MKVAVAMSGGVDSSVAAALLKAKGYDIFGVTMQLWPGMNDDHAVQEAKDVAGRLGIPHYTVDLENIFASEVVADFCREYGLGRTPNPCIRCNRYIKFGALLERAVELGADLIATGHYAKLKRGEDGYLLQKGKDQNKDQSYFLYALTQEQLSRALFPVGDFTKREVRVMAAGWGLSAKDRAESQEICFIPGDSYPEFLKSHCPQIAQPGPIVDEVGNILGQHRGIAFYTVGQRKRLGIAAAEPLYVTAIEPEHNVVRVSNREKIYGQELVAAQLNWIVRPRDNQPFQAKAKLRYRQPEAEATITPFGDNTVRVVFRELQMAITPGQAVVFYDGDTVMGGGTIMSQGDI
jgi:tRNA-specific 2-thiouridylase